MNQLQGKLLIASPSMEDPNFHETVVLMALHDEDGALGLVLNREIDLSLKDIWSQVSDDDYDGDEQVRGGGPVSSSLMAVHGRPDLGNLRVTDELFLTTDKAEMERLVAAGESAIFFLGHAGWGPGQLEREMSELAWLTLPATANQVFGDVESLWRSV
ncbi:MAG: YqgE/AlgH family protein, partial [Planctomycetia bacterium]